MEKLMGTGKARAIGVSNYSKRYLEQLLPHATIIPAVNQIENHPALPQQEIVDFCKEKGIHVTAYSPLGSAGSPLMTAAPILEVAQRKQVSPATVLLSWHGMYRVLRPHGILILILVLHSQLLVALLFSPNQPRPLVSRIIAN